MPDQYVSSDSFSYPNLIAGNKFPIMTDRVKLKAGSSYMAGSVLAIITATDKAVLVDSTKSDGSQTVHGILAADVDATSEDKDAVVYLTGEFNQAALKFGGTDTVATHKYAMRKIGIFLRTTRKA